MLKSSRFKSKSYIAGIGYGFLLILLLSSQKSEMKQIFPFSLGIINVDVTHSELFSRYKTPIFTNLLIFF